MSLSQNGSSLTSSRRIFSSTRLVTFLLPAWKLKIKQNEPNLHYFTHKNWYFVHFIFGFCTTIFFPWNEKCKRKVLSKKKKKTKYWQLRFSSKIEAPQLGSTRNLFSSRNFSSNSLQPSTEQAQGCLTSVIQREFQKYFDSIVKEEGKRL